MKDNSKLIQELRKVVGRKYVFTDNLNKNLFQKGGGMVKECISSY